MSDTTSNKNQNKEVTAFLLGYLSARLVESIKALNKDLLANCEFASTLLQMPTYLRLLELGDKLEALIFSN